MKFTRISLIYLATYLTGGGLGFLFFPTQFSLVLLSSVVYEEVPLRLAGMFSLLLGIVVIQIVRHRVDVLYSTSVLARVIGLVVLMTLYVQTSNPMFMSLLVIVLIGFIFTGIGLLRDRKNT